MKIAFVDVTVTVSFGGIQTAVWELARTLHDLGHEVSVFGGVGEIRPDLGGRNIPVRTFPFTPREKALDLGSRFRRFWERWTFARHVRPEIIAGDFDWVIITKPFDFFWPYRMPAGSRTRFAFRSGGTDFILGDRKLAKGISAWFANSHFNAWQIKSRYGRYPTVIYNGVDLESFGPHRRDEALRERIGLAAGEVACMFAGRLVGWKGVSVTLQALAILVREGLPVRFVLIGDGPEREPLLRQASALGLEGRLLMQGAKGHGELPVWWASADIGVFSSIGDEGFSNSIAEAMASGLPVVATAFSGNPETVGNEGSCGLLVQPGDPEALAEALRPLILDRVLREKLGKAARQRIATQFTWEMVAQRLLSGLKP